MGGSQIIRDESGEKRRVHDRVLPAVAEQERDLKPAMSMMNWVSGLRVKAGCSDHNSPAASAT